MKHIKHIAIALFGGTGERFGAPYPKQFVNLGGEPMLVVTLRGLSQCVDIDEIYVVSHADSLDDTRNLIVAHQIKKIKAIIKGGNTRQASSRLALEFLKKSGTPEDAIVLICDGDRPCIDPQLIHDCFLAAEDNGASVAAVPCTDSVLLSRNGKHVDEYVPRKSVYLVQTPQAFLFRIIYKAHKNGKRKEVTDDASLLVGTKVKIAIVPGRADNIKITVPDDVKAYLAWKDKKR